jgi:membrane protease YdiL (CAAX protease family)
MSANDPVPEPVQENGAPAWPEDVVPGPAPDGVTSEVPPPARKPGPPHPGLGWAALWMLLLLFVTQLVVPIAVLVPVLIIRALLAPDAQAYLAQFGAPGFAGSAEFAAILWPALLATQLSALLLSWLALRLVAGRDWPRRVALRRPGLAHLGLAVLIFPAALMIGQGMADLAQRLRVPHLFDVEQTVRIFGEHWPWWLTVLLVGVGPGLWEELWCRGFLGRGLVGRWGVAGGIVLTSLFFGAMHVEPHQVIYAPAVGAILHFVYWTSRSLWLPMLLHAVNNSLAVLVVSKSSPLPQLRQMEVLETAAAAYPALVYGGAVVLLLAVGYAFYQSRARIVGEDGGPPPWRPAYPGVECPPPGSGAAVAHPRPSPAAVALALAGLLVFVGCCWLAVALLPA